MFLLVYFTPLLSLYALHIIPTPLGSRSHRSWNSLKVERNQCRSASQITLITLCGRSYVFLVGTSVFLKLFILISPATSKLSLLKQSSELIWTDPTSSLYEASVTIWSVHNTARAFKVTKDFLQHVLTALCALCVWQEGKQASLAADFSVTQFKHLGRLLMVHGRNSYKRSAALSQFVIHRSLCISTMQVGCGYSVLPVWRSQV